MKYVRNGEIYESPIKANVEGIDIELVSSQLHVLGYRTIEEIENEQATALESVYDTDEAKRTVMDAMEVKIPAGGDVITGSLVKLPFKLGSKWEPKYSRGSIVYELVEDPMAVGVESNPIYYHYGVQLVPNAFYMISLKKYVYVGQPGTAEDFDEVMKDMEPWYESEPGSVKEEANDADHAFPFADGIEVVPNYYYSHDGGTYVYVGARKTAQSWDEVSGDMVEW